MAAVVPAPDPALTPLQARFCEEYVVDVDREAAYVRARGRSRKQASSITHEWLQLPAVKARIAALVAARSQRTAITADTVLQELLRIARCDIGQAFAPDGTLKALRDMPEDVRRAISAIDVDEITAKHGGRAVVIGHTRKVKFWNKVDALQHLGRHLKLFVDRVQLEDATGRAGRLQRARARKAS